MARQYNPWNNKRNSGERLDNIPFITNTLDNTKRYYSAIDAELYFGDIFIDEVTNITWTVQQQTLPIYGYNSYTFDDMAVGSRLVQGQFAVNFIKENYLLSIQEDSHFNSIARRTYGEDKPTEGVFSTSPKRRLGLPLWDKGFDIVIGFGEHGNTSSLKQNIYSTYLVLDCCQLVSSQMSLDYNGEPIQEIYTFVARDIKYATDSRGLSGITTETVSNDNLHITGHISKTTGEIILAPMTNIRFSSGNIGLEDIYSNKKIAMIRELSPTGNSNLKTSALDADTLKAFKSEIAALGLTSIKASLKMNYQLTSDPMASSSDKTASMNIELNIV